MPCGPVTSIAEIFDDEHYKARDNIAYIKDDRIGELAVANVCPRMSDTPGGINWLGPEVGAHTDEILSDRLGLTANAISALRKKGII